MPRLYSLSSWFCTSWAIALAVLVPLTVPEDAFTAPRFSTAHHTSSFGQSKPKFGSLSVNTRISESTVAELKNRGHVVTVGSGNAGGVALIGLEAGSGVAHGIGSGASAVH